MNGVAHTSSPSNVRSVVSSEDGDHVSTAASSIAPSSMDAAMNVPDVQDLNNAGPSSSSDEVAVESKKKVGYDRGLEANFIVGSTKEDGKLMFLMAWKNSVDGEADLVEATEVYEKSPQVAIKYFEKHLVCERYYSRRSYGRA